MNIALCGGLPSKAELSVTGLSATDRAPYSYVAKGLPYEIILNGRHCGAARNGILFFRSDALARVNLAQPYQIWKRCYTKHISTSVIQVQSTVIAPSFHPRLY